MPLVTSSPITGVELAPHTTLRLGGPAARFVQATDCETLVEAVAGADRAGEPLLLLGRGSNLVIGDAGFDGTVVRLATTGSRVDGDVLVAEAGEDWDTVVRESVEAGFGGLECLSGIPGLVGATPVQNVGAYGVEVGDLLVSADVLDRRTGTVHTMRGDQLGLGFRTSMLKRGYPGVVLRVRFALRGDGLSEPIRYAELARMLGVEVGERVPSARAREAVLQLRRGKGMVLDASDHDTWSVGSFFVNPILAEPQLAEVLARTGAGVPRYPAAGGGTKLSAAWLIEHAGFPRGYAGPDGRVSLSSKHTLALTNRGRATTADLLVLAREVRDGVHRRFGVLLRPEPVLVNCAL